MEDRHRIGRSIGVSITALMAFQIMFTTMVAVLYGIDGFGNFLITTLLVHLGLGSFLLLMKDDFVIVPTDSDPDRQEKHIDRVNTANLLTMFRISSTPTILFLLLHTGEHDIAVIVVVFVTVAFLTDLSDGLVSRKTHQVTRIGKYLDSMSDYGILIAVSITFLHYSIIPSWFFALVMVRFLVQWIGLSALFIYQGFLIAKSSFLGKVSIFTIMALYAAATLTFFERLEPHVLGFFSALVYIAAGIILVSAVEKAYILIQDFLDAGRAKAGERIGRE